MDASTRILHETLIRLLKGMVKAYEEWLKKHNFKYHGLLMNKPRGGNYHWIDNHIVKATRFNGKFTDLVIESKKIQVFKD